MPNPQGPPLEGFMPQLPGGSNPWEQAAAMQWNNYLAMLQQSQEAFGGLRSLYAGEPALLNEANNSRMLQELQSYQGYNDQMQQLAMQQAQGQQELQLQMAQNLMQQAMAGVPAEQARAGIEALIGASGYGPDAMQNLLPAFNAFYGAQGQSPFFQEQVDTQLKNQLYPLVLQAYASKKGHATDANKLPDVQQAVFAAMAQRATSGDQAAAQLLQQDPNQIAEMVRLIYRDTRTRFAPGADEFQETVGRMGGDGGGGPSLMDRLAGAAQGTAFGGAVGSFLPGVGTLLGMGIGGLGGLLLAKGGPEGQSNVERFVSGPIQTGLSGLTMGGLSRFALGKVAPGMFAGQPMFSMFPGGGSPMAPAAAAAPGGIGTMGGLGGLVAGPQAAPLAAYSGLSYNYPPQWGMPWSTPQMMSQPPWMFGG